MTYLDARAKALATLRRQLIKDGWTEERIDQFWANAKFDDPDVHVESLTARAERWIPQALDQGMTPAQIEKALRYASLPPTDLARLVDYAYELANQ